MCRLSFLGGVSGLALLVSHGLLAPPAHAKDVNNQRTPLTETVRGADGRAASKGRDGTGGTDGPGLSYRTLGSLGVMQVMKRPMVSLTTTGGEGGKAYASITTKKWGGEGGRGGSIVYVDQSRLRLRLASQAEGIALIQLLSRGGRGGAWDTWSFGLGKGFQDGRSGGPGGDVTFEAQSDLRLVGEKPSGADKFAAVRVTSQGGDAGTGGAKVLGPHEESAYVAGGRGGTAKAVVHAGVTVSTQGRAAPALIVETLGGNGAAAGSTGLGDSLRGSDGGEGCCTHSTTMGAIFINNGTVTTDKDLSSAVILQSVGGKGGNGTGGQEGGSGGSGGNVLVDQGGVISTAGRYAIGLFAQSVGGTGGSGGSGAFWGGSGGDAGEGGKVKITNRGTVTTLGEGAIAIAAQSVGGGDALDGFQAQPIVPRGGGGSGGSATVPFLASGGDGGTGGAGGAVTIGNTGVIETGGNAAHGIFAQSVGGSGGVGGDAKSLGAFLSFSLGGSGGGGGNGGRVAVDTANGATPSSITTKGNEANAIFAQSIGGGGGTGGAAWAASGGVVGSVAMAFGGSGGKGGHGGAVHVGNAASLLTYGQGATAIQVLSVGGGGGTGGSASSYALAVPLPKLPAVSVAVGLGGSGGEGGNGGAVDVHNTAPIVTNGRDAMGMDLLSVGGGGGSAGAVTTWALSLAAFTPSFSTTFTFGGTGKKGGHGGMVSAENTGTITTWGNNAIGIRAASIGGGGGSGSLAKAASSVIGIYKNTALSYAKGGKGEEGGNGGAVTVENKKDVLTYGLFATGISATSIGGGGGVGGSGDSGAKAGIITDFFLTKQVDSLMDVLPMADTVTVNASLGGKGGGGGHGGVVTVTNSGRILTASSNSTAIEAVSIGGGGGTGGGFLGGGEGERATNFKFGAEGGKGGNGGDVKVRNAAGGYIETQGSGSNGITALSIGGGGGISGGFSGDREKSVDAKGWADGITTFLSETLKINKVTKEFAKKKIPAVFDKNSTTQQAANYLKSALGVLKALVKADKDNMTDSILQVSGALTAAGLQVAAKAALKTRADKVLADMKEKDPSKVAADIPKVTLNLTFGDTGGDGGNGGDINDIGDVMNAGTIRTNGTTSFGILAQSVGGGGGAGGAVYADGNNVINLNGTIGATGGKGGNGGIVLVKNSGTIETHGDMSSGILAQSIGGGGGIAGGIANSNTISISANLMIGGSGGASGNGRRVEVVNSGTVSTTGFAAHGIMAQSVGGGGGILLMDPAGPGAGPKIPAEAKDVVAEYNAFLAELLASKGTNVNDLSPPLAPQFVVDNATTYMPKPTLTAQFGGDGTGGGDGGAVDVIHSGSIATTGTGAFGIFAQSIGGGGGAGGTVTEQGKWYQNLLNRTMGFGGKGGSSGSGGPVVVELGSGSSITTTGDGATGIFLQSIGGGGGYGGTYKFGNSGLNYNSGSSRAGGGYGGSITVRTPENAKGMSITTTGERAHGIFAQSIGGGGGTVVDLSSAPIPLTTKTTSLSGSTGNGRDVTVDLQGSISATGKDAYGIFIQSGRQLSNGAIGTDGTETGGPVKITYSGMLTGGTDTGAAIRIDTTGYSTVDVGLNSLIQAYSGTAMVNTIGRTTVRNDGTVVGDLNLALSSGSAFQNRERGVYRTAGQNKIDLGPGGYFDNRGTLDLGGAGNVVHATMTGKYEQSGKLLVDILPEAKPTGSFSDPSNRNNDSLAVTGPVIFERDSTIQITSLTWLLPGQYIVLTSDRTIAGRPAVETQTQGVVPLSWNVSGSGTKSISISPVADFTRPKGVTLNADQSAVAQRFQSYWDNSSTAQAELFPLLFSLKTGTQYAQALDEISPDDTQDVLASSVEGVRTSLTGVMSCPAFQDASTLLQEGECLWARVQANRTTMTTSAVQGGYSLDAMTYRIGGQREIAPDWYLGLSASYSQGTSNEAGGASNSDLSTYDASVAIKRQMGPWLLAASATAGKTFLDNHRVATVGAYNAVLESTSSVFFAGARLRGGYEFTMPDWYVRPYLDLDAMYFETSAYSETGTPGFALDVRAGHQFVLALNPNVEIGGRINLDDGYWLRPFGTIGFTWRSQDSFTTRASLQGTPGWIADFDTSTTIPDNILNLSAGFQLASGQGLDLTGEYRADVANNFLSHTGSAKLAIRF